MRTVTTLLGGMLLIAACSSSSPYRQTGPPSVSNPAATYTSPPPRPDFTYRVTGDASSVSIKYLVGMSLRELHSVTLPWTHQVDAYENYYNVLAEAHDGTTITCEILRSDGHVFEERTSRVRDPVVNCSHLEPGSE